MAQPKHNIPILLVDDDEEDFIIVKKLADSISHTSFALEWEPDIERARARIDQAEHAAYLIDYRLAGGETGLELLGAYNLFERIEPFIILTGAGDEVIEQQAMEMGVADYLVKGSFDSELLSRVLRYSMQRKNLEAQRIQQLLEINRSKDEFIALASHQLRTPATAVKQYIGMMLEGYAGPLDEVQSDMLRTAYESNERQLSIVNDILRVAQLDLDKVVIKPTLQDMDVLVDSVLSDIRPVAKERSQKLVYVSPPDTVVAEADSDFFRMALGNIVDNASKYTPEGGAIYVTLEGYPGGSATIEVRDEGVGIAPDDMNKLFKKFSRIQNVLSVEVGGTGLGLYWANQVVELHDGTIQVSSRPGRGTTFLITLPPAKS